MHNTRCADQLRDVYGYYVCRKHTQGCDKNPLGQNPAVVNSATRADANYTLDHEGVLQLVFLKFVADVSRIMNIDVCSITVARALAGGRAGARLNQDDPSQVVLDSRDLGVAPEAMALTRATMFQDKVTGLRTSVCLHPSTQGISVSSWSAMSILPLLLLDLRPPAI